MKKKIVTWLAVLLVLALAAGLWFYGYHNRKSNDNIPSKELLVTYYKEKGEDYASEKLEGYTKSQLEAVWGVPQGFLSGLWGDIWDVDDTTYIIVYFRSDGSNDGVVESVKVSEREA